MMLVLGCVLLLVCGVFFVSCLNMMRGVSVQPTGERWRASTITVGLFLTALLLWGALAAFGTRSDNSWSRFIVFLGLVGVWHVALRLYFGGSASGIVEARMFGREVAGLFMWLMPLVVFVYALSGFWSWYLTLFLLVGSAVTLACKRLLFLAFGSRDSTWLLQFAYATTEFQMRKPGVAAGIGTFDSFVVALFPVACAVAYFSSDYPSTDLTTAVLKTTLGLYVLSGGVSFTAQTIIPVSSPYIDENTRARAFLIQLTGLIPLAMVLALALWVFGLGGRPVDMGGVSMALSLPLLSVLVAYFALAGLVPYLIGYRRGKRVQLAILEDLAGWFRRTTPGEGSYATQLRDLHNDLKEKTSALEQTDPLVSFYEDGEDYAEMAADSVRHVDSEEVWYSARGTDYPRYSEGAWQIGRQLLVLRQVHPRLKSWLKLVDLRDAACRMAEEIEPLASAEADIRANRYGLQYRDTLDEIRAQAEQVKHEKPRLMVVLGFLASVILSTGVVDAAQRLWSSASELL